MNFFYSPDCILSHSIRCCFLYFFQIPEYLFLPYFTVKKIVNYVHKWKIFLTNIMSEHFFHIRTKDTFATMKLRVDIVTHNDSKIFDYTYFLPDLTFTTLIIYQWREK